MSISKLHTVLIYNFKQKTQIIKLSSKGDRTINRKAGKGSTSEEENQATKTPTDGASADTLLGMSYLSSHMLDAHTLMILSYCSKYILY